MPSQLTAGHQPPLPRLLTLGPGSLGLALSASLTQRKEAAFLGKVSRSTFPVQLRLPLCPGEQLACGPYLSDRQGLRFPNPLPWLVPFWFRSRKLLCPLSSPAQPEAPPLLLWNPPSRGPPVPPRLAFFLARPSHSTLPAPPVSTDPEFPCKCPCSLFLSCRMFPLSQTHLLSQQLRHPGSWPWASLRHTRPSPLSPCADPHSH